MHFTHNGTFHPFSVINSAPSCRPVASLPFSSWSCYRNRFKCAGGPTPKKLLGRHRSTHKSSMRVTRVNRTYIADQKESRPLFKLPISPMRASRHVCPCVDCIVRSIADVSDTCLLRIVHFIFEIMCENVRVTADTHTRRSLTVRTSSVLPMGLYWTQRC